MVQGIEQPRVARDGTDLPSARQVAFTLFPDADVPDNRITLSVMQWGHKFNLVIHVTYRASSLGRNNQTTSFNNFIH